MPGTATTRPSRIDRLAVLSVEPRRASHECKTSRILQVPVSPLVGLWQKSDLTRRPLPGVRPERSLDDVALNEPMTCYYFGDSKLSRMTSDGTQHVMRTTWHYCGSETVKAPRATSARAWTVLLLKPNKTPVPLTDTYRNEQSLF